MKMPENGSEGKRTHQNTTKRRATSYSFVFIWHHVSKVSLTVAAFFWSAGSVNENIGPLTLEPPGVVGVEGVLGDGELR